jgi:hypothetical protein
VVAAFGKAEPAVHFLIYIKKMKTKTSFGRQFLNFSGFCHFLFKIIKKTTSEFHFLFYRFVLFVRFFSPCLATFQFFFQSICKSTKKKTKKKTKNKKKNPKPQKSIDKKRDKPRIFHLLPRVLPPRNDHHSTLQMLAVLNIPLILLISSAFTPYGPPKVAALLHPKTLGADFEFPVPLAQLFPEAAEKKSGAAGKKKGPWAAVSRAKSGKNRVFWSAVAGPAGAAAENGASGAKNARNRPRFRRKNRVFCVLGLLRIDFGLFETGFVSKRGGFMC